MRTAWRPLWSACRSGSTDPTPSRRSTCAAWSIGCAPLVAAPIVLQDERLSSHEADSRLALTERDWRKRKARLDAASAAVILQDYLDSRTLHTPSHAAVED